MQIKEIMDKTGAVLVGVVVGVNEYISKKTGVSYWSVDLTMKGCKQAVNVRLPPGYPIQTLTEYELVKIPCSFRQNFSRTGIEIEALPVAR